MANRKRQRLVDDVTQLASNFFQGTLPWYRRLPDEHRDEVMELKAAFKAGEWKLPLRTIARFISKLLRERGIATVGEQGVQSWLKSDD